MKKALLAITLFFGCSTAALALQTPSKQSTLSLGIAKFTDAVIDNAHPSGISFKHQHQPNGQNLGLMSSLTYAGDTIDIQPMTGFEAKLKANYYSFAMGPSYRLGDRVTLYGLVGIACGQVRIDAADLKLEDQAIMYGVGIRLNPLSQLIIDAHYEHSDLSFTGMDLRGNIFSAGLGYRF